ncbi:uncharacterized protein G2W53_029922 [Senna tora]|uniref:Uncharacterized protein n=1 Tax=Senna tora TaxID=362788 RepID=A0A834T6E2_9FABA|nr:uncharacterized protein G2W53_029922 [Senna tora]
MSTKFLVMEARPRSSLFCWLHALGRLSATSFPAAEEVCEVTHDVGICRRAAGIVVGVFAIIGRVEVIFKIHSVATGVAKEIGGAAMIVTDDPREEVAAIFRLASRDPKPEAEITKFHYLVSEVHRNDDVPATAKRASTVPDDVSIRPSVFKPPIESSSSSQPEHRTDLESKSIMPNEVISGSLRYENR